jgi:hypothetical protein
MKETNLNVFYHFGSSLGYLESKATIGALLIDLFPYLLLTRDWATHFLGDTLEFESALKDTRASAQAVFDKLQELILAAPTDLATQLTQPDVVAIMNGKGELEKNFEREHKNLSVFTVTPKGLYDTRLLIEKGEEKFGETTRSVFNADAIYDLQQSGKCLAFEVPTAMAFHVMRATETLIKAYYEVLAGKPWPYPQRDWGRYIVELEKFPGVNKTITGRLNEIRELNRNPLIHPEIIVSMEEAPVLFELCNGVIYYMAEEIRKRK